MANGIGVLIATRFLQGLGASAPAVFAPGIIRSLFDETASLKSPRYLRYSASHALVLGGLLIFVFGAPTVIVHSLGGGSGDFVRMQVMGVACFIGAANITTYLVKRNGAESIIVLGTILASLSSVSLLVYALAGGRDPLMVAVLFMPMNLGLGLRGPPGFLAAIIAGDGDDDRAASLAILFITAVSAGGTALLEPFIHLGLTTLSGAVAVLQAAAVMMLILSKPPQ